MMLRLGQILGLVIVSLFAIITIRYFRKARSKRGFSFWMGIWVAAFGAIAFFDTLNPIAKIINIPTFSLLTILAFALLIMVCWHLFVTLTQQEKKIREIVEEQARRDFKK